MMKAVMAVMGVLLVLAGILAFIPLEKASTTHSTLIAALYNSTGLGDDSITADTIADAAITASEAPNLDVPVSSRADGSAYTSERAANLDNLDATVSSRATSADFNSHDRFLSIVIPTGTSNIDSTPVTLEKTDGYAGHATIITTITAGQPGKKFKLEADTDGDGVADTDVVSITISSTGTKLGTGDIPVGTDRLFIFSNASAMGASFSATVIIHFDTITP